MFKFYCIPSTFRKFQVIIIGLLHRIFTLKLILAASVFRHLVENQLSDILINSVVVNDSIEYQVLNKKYFLPLALYYIEKEARFTESGIWKEKYNENTVSMLTGKFSDFS